MRNCFRLTASVATLAILLLGCQPLLPMKRTISVNVTVPNPAWRVQIERVHLGNERLHVVSRLSLDPGAGMVAQVISQATDTITLSAPDLPIEHHILGKTWNWAEENHNFVTQESALKKTLANSQILYTRKNKNTPSP